MMQHKKKIRTGFTAILLSALFLCNPVVAFLDILPNSIGYLLLCFGLHRLADLSARLTDALRRFRILLLLSVAQLLAVYLIYGVMAGQASQMNPYEQPVYILLGSFVMLFFQWYYLIPAFGDLFGGIDHLADKHSADALTQTKRNKTPAERMKRSASVFVIASSLLAFLPELTILTSFENDVGNRFFPFDWYEFIGVLRILCFAVSLIFSLVFLVRMITFCRSAKRDGEWIERLEAQYSEDVLPQTGMLTVRRFSLALFLVQLGLIFTVNLRMNGYAVLPGCGFALLVAWAIFYLREQIGKAHQKKGYFACAALAAVSFAQILVNSAYLRNFLPEASLYQSDAYQHYLIVRIISGTEAVVTCILVGVMLTWLWQIILSHTGVDYGSRDAALLSSAATERLHRGFQIRLAVTFVLFFVAMIGNILDAILLLEYSWIWLISFAVSFAGICSASSLLHELKVQIQFRYQSDGMNKKL